jgi:TP901 family phage tail tape measure protein
MSGELGKVVVVIGGDSSGLDQVLAAIHKELGTAEKKVQKLGESLKQTGEKMQQAARPMMVFGAAITGGLGLAVKSFGDFDAAMNESVAIMGDVDDAMRQGMVNAAKDVARTTTFSAKEAAAAFYYLASAGLNAEQSIAALPAVAKFAQAGMMGLEVATEYLMNSQAALGLKVDDAAQNMENMARVSDVLVEAANVSNGSITQFAEALSNSAPTMRNLNMEIEAGVAVLSVYADQGIKGEEAGTRFSIVLRDLQTRAIKNTDALKKYNVAVYNSAGKMRNMAAIVADLEKALAGKTDAQKKSILAEMEFQDRSISSLLSLVGMSKEIANYETKLKSAGGTTEEVAEKQLKTLNNQLKLAKNNIENAAITVGAQFAPAIANLAKKISEVVAGYAKWAEAHPAVSGAINGVLAVLGTSALAGGTLLFALGSAAKSIGALMGLFPKLKLGFFGVGTAVIALAAEMAVFLSTLWELKKAIDYESTANDRLVESNIKLENKLYGLVTAGKMTMDQFYKLKDQFYAGGKGADDYAQKMWNWIKSGKAGTDAAEGLAKMSAESAKQTKAAGVSAKGAAGDVDDLGGSMDGAAGETKSLKDELGLTFKSDVAARIKQIETALVSYKDKLSPESEKKLREELVSLQNQFKAALPPVRDWSGVLEKVPGTLEDVTFYAETLEGQIKKLSDGMSVSEATVQLMAYEMARLKLSMVGIVIPDMRIPEEASNSWANFNQEIAADFIKAVGSIITGTATIKESILSLCSSVQNMWVNAMANIFSEALKAGKNIGQAFAELGTAIINPISAAVFVVTNFISGMVNASEGYAKQIAQNFADAAKHVQNELQYLGEISDTTSAKIVELTLKFGDATAQAMTLGDQMRDTGINASNFDIYLSKATNTLTLYGQGLLTAAQASEEAEDQFGQLLAAAQALGQEGSVAMVNFIVTAREMGLEIASVTQYVQSQLNTIPAALEQMVSVIPTLDGAVGKLNEKLAGQEAALKKLKPGTDAYNRLADAITKTKESIAGATAEFRGNLETIEDVKNAGTLAVTTFNSMVASGMSWGQALAAVGPTLATLKDRYTELGMAADPALQELMNIAKVREEHKNLFDSIDANLQVMQALANTGFLTGEALAAIEKNANGFYNKLIKAGVSSDDALRTMAPTLQAIYDAHVKSGEPIDKNTQKLIDQAMALGLIEEATPDPGEQMVAGLDRVAVILEAIAEALGATIPEAVELAADAITDEMGPALDGIEDKVDGLGDTIKEDLPAAAATAASEMSGSFKDAVKATNRTLGELAFPDFHIGDVGTGGTAPRAYATGGVAWRPQLATIAERGPEVIIPMNDYQSGTGLAAGVGAGTGAGATSTNHISVTINAQTLDDRTIQQAGEKIQREIERQQKRRGW